jgi:hypothetical protein
MTTSPRMLIIYARTGRPRDTHHEPAATRVRGFTCALSRVAAELSLPLTSHVRSTRALLALSQSLPSRRSPSHSTHFFFLSLFSFSPSFLSLSFLSLSSSFFSGSGGATILFALTERASTTRSMLVSVSSAA